MARFVDPDSTSQLRSPVLRPEVGSTPAGGQRQELTGQWTVTAQEAALIPPAAAAVRRGGTRVTRESIRPKWRTALLPNRCRSPTHKSPLETSPIHGSKGMSRTNRLQSPTTSPPIRTSGGPDCEPGKLIRSRRRIHQQVTCRLIAIATHRSADASVSSGALAATRAAHALRPPSHLTPLTGTSPRPRLTSSASQSKYP